MSMAERHTLATNEGRCKTSLKMHRGECRKNPSCPCAEQHHRMLCPLFEFSGIMRTLGMAPIPVTPAGVLIKPGNMDALVQQVQDLLKERNAAQDVAIKDAIADGIFAERARREYLMKEAADKLKKDHADQIQWYNEELRKARETDSGTSRDAKERPASARATTERPGPSREKRPGPSREERPGPNRGQKSRPDKKRRDHKQRDHKRKESRRDDDSDELPDPKAMMLLLKKMAKNVNKKRRRRQSSSSGSSTDDRNGRSDSRSPSAKRSRNNSQEEGPSGKYYGRSGEKSARGSSDSSEESSGEEYAPSSKKKSSR